MPPKKKAPKKSKGKKGDDEEEKIKELGKILENEVKVVQQRIGSIFPIILVLEENKANRSNENVEKYREMELKISEEIEQVRREKDQITSSMSMQIKNMEDTMTRKMKTQEEAVAKYTEELKKKNESIEAIQKETEDMIRASDDEIHRLENHMEMMSSEFMSMLKVLVSYA